MIRFSIGQKKYINSPIDQHIYLKACPGSGKTEVVAAKVAKEMARWDQSPGGMAILSFANSATDELKERIGKYKRHDTSHFPHFVGTFDSFILKHIVSPIAHEITGYEGKEGDYSIRLVENGSPVYFKTKYAYAKKGNQRANQYDYDMATEQYIFNTGNRVLNKILNNIDFEGWQHQDLENTKKKFLKAGFATYRDIEHLAIEIFELKRTDGYVKLIAQKFPFIIIDECQDLSLEQLTILQELADLGVKLHLIGDINQSIYGFRNADPRNITNFINKTNDTELELITNRRSAQPIVDLCCSLVDSDKITGNRPLVKNCCKVLMYNECPTEVLPTFKQLTNKYKNKNIAVVARSHATLAKFTGANKSLNEVESLALSIALFDVNNMQKLEQSLSLFSEYLRLHLKAKESVRPVSFNCPESISSSLRWRQFLFNALSYLVSKGLANTTLTWTKWCKEIQTQIRELTKEPFADEQIAELLISLKDIKHRSPSGKSSEAVGDTLQLTVEQQEQLRFTTIHQVKGETHDATMLVSGIKAGGESNWKDWLKDPSSEAARFAYVASSRPKHMLIWAVKKLKAADQKKLEMKLKNIGFTITPLITQPSDIV